MGRNVRVQLPGMEGNVLSGEAARVEDAAVLRRAVPDRRNQLHVLSRAERENPRRMEQGDARAVQADAEGAEADYPRRAAARLRRPGPAVPRDGRLPWAQAWRAVIS